MGGGSSKPKPFTITVNVYDLANNQTNNLISSVLGKISNIEYNTISVLTLL